jgi:O-antigen/teichoic acid export membrane protein
MTLRKFETAFTLIFGRRYMNTASRLYSNSGFLMLNSGVGAGLGFFYWAVAARITTPEYVGLGSALVSASGFLSFFGSLGLGYGLIRFLPDSKTPVRLINTCLTFSAITTAVLVILFISTISLWNPSLSFVGRSFPYSTAYVIMVVMIGILGLLNQVYLSLRRADFSVLQTTVFGLIKISTVFMMVLMFQAFGIFAAWGLGATVAISLSLLFLLPKLQPEYRPTPDLGRKLGKKIFRFSIANFTAEGLWNTPNWLLPLIIAGLLGGEANAYFYVSWSLAGLVFTIPLSISSSLFAEGSYRQDTLSVDIRRGMKLAIILIPLAVLILLGLGTRLLSLFGAQYAAGGTGLLWVLLPAVFPLSINTGYIGVLRVQKRLGEIVLLTTTISSITIILSCVLVPRYGIQAAGLSWLIGQGTACIYTLPKITKIARRPSVSVG